MTTAGLHTGSQTPGQSSLATSSRSYSESFQRLGGSRPGDDDGLGLSIVAAVATAHHAALSARPGPTGGLDICVTFPAAAETTAPPQVAYVPT